MVRAMGLKGYVKSEIVQGDRRLVMHKALGELNREARVAVNFAEPSEGVRYRDDMLCPVGFFPKSGQTLATIDGRPVMILNRLPNGSVVYSCGFPLGFTYYFKHNELKYPDAMNPVYGAMLQSAGVPPLLKAPSNVGVWISDNANLVLVKKLGDWDTGSIRLPKPDRAVYTQAKNVLRDGQVALDLDLPRGRVAVWLERLAEVIGGTNVTVSKGTVQGERTDRLRFTIAGRGECNLTLSLWPNSTYTVTAAGARQHLRSNSQGRATISVRLGSPLQIEAIRVKWL